MLLPWSPPSAAISPGIEKRMNLIEYTRMYEAEEHHWWYVGLHRLILATVQNESLRLGRPLKIFDAGCGTGRLCQLMAEPGHAVRGCDASMEALHFCRLRGITSVYHADLNTLELEPESFDVITSIDVLYHAGVSGMLILNLVALEFLRSTHDIAVHTRERYTRCMLCERLQQAGFDIVQATYRVSFLFPFISVYRLLSRFTLPTKSDPAEVASDVSLPNQLVNALLLKVIELENIVLRKAALPFGSSVFVVARKPL